MESPQAHSTGIALERKPAPAGELFSSPLKRATLLALVLTAVTLITYSPLKDNGFINYDDDRYVTQNLRVQAGLTWSNVAWAFRSTDVSNWHPLTWISHMADVQLFGLNPAGHHLTSLMLHLANALLLFAALYLGTGCLFPSFLMALIFALHPLNVQSVAWVAERKNVLSTLFWLLAIIAYGWYARSADWKRYTLLMVLFAFGLMSKPMVITLPAVLLLLDYWPLGRLCPSAAEPPTMETRSAVFLIVEKIPLILMAGASAAVTLLAQRSGGAVVADNLLPLKMRLGNALVSYVNYIAKLFWPSHLAVYYPYQGAGLGGWQVASSTLLLVAITVAVWKLRARRYLLVGWLYFLITLLPVIGIIQAGDQASADRYMYLPMMGLLVLPVWGLAELARPHGRVFVSGVGILALCFAIRTRRELSYWHDSTTLFARALAVTENNVVANANLGRAYDEAGRPQEAMRQYQAALALDPSDPVDHYNVAAHLQQLGQNSAAVSEYDAVLRLTMDPELLARAHNNLAMAERSLGELSAAQADFEAAIRLRPYEPRPYLNLAALLEQQGRLSEAIAVYQAEVDESPSAMAYYFMGGDLEQESLPREAARAYKEALRLAPGLREARVRLQAIEGSLEN